MVIETNSRTRRSRIVERPTGIRIGRSRGPSYLQVLGRPTHVGERGDCDLNSNQRGVEYPGHAGVTLFKPDFESAPTFDTLKSSGLCYDPTRQRNSGTCVPS